jgi:Protein of unknown function (DUF1194)
MPLRQLLRRGALISALLGGLLGIDARAASAQELAVDLELVLAIDISGSVDEVEARLQREGYIAALRHPQVIEAIQGGMLGRIALTYVEWAGDYYQRSMLDWTLIEGPDDAQSFAAALAETPLVSAHWTSLSGAIDYAVPLFDNNGFKGIRRVIDISGDGYNNRGRPVESARDAAVAAGITINGLPIVNDRPNPWGGLPPVDLDLYYEQRVIGGPGAFLIVAEDYSAFASAILSKLLLEVAGPQPSPRTRAALRPQSATRDSPDENAAYEGGVAARSSSAARPAPHSSATPVTADSIEAANTAILAAAKSASAGNAWPAMNNDMVKPMPANTPAPAN